MDLDECRREAKMTTICHVSDTHGYLVPLMAADVVVHSGDFMPSFTRGIRACEVPRQERWVADNMPRLKAWIGDRPFLFVPGNHDYYDPIQAMVDAGIDARDVTGTTFLGCHRVYGFPYVPVFTGEWNYEIFEDDIARRFDTEGADIVIAHSPIYGVLDRNAQGGRCGSKAIRAYLQDPANAAPEWYLCGHIHESAGTQGWSRGIKISNAATTRRVITI